jgi:hypothetical protein
VLKWLVLFLVICGLGVWFVFPIAREPGSSWCARVNTYAFGQRLTHDGELPWAASMRVSLSSCGDSDGSHATYR